MTLRTVIAPSLLVLVACQGGSPEPAAPPPGRLALEFEGAADPVTGALSIAWTAEARQALQALPVDKNGVAGTGAPGTVELVTTRVGVDVAGCGVASSFCGDVRMQSFFASGLSNAYVEITRLTPATGHEGLNSAAPCCGLSDRYGLWSYGGLGPAGTVSDAATRTWIFRNLDGSPFSFKGRVMADIGGYVPRASEVVASGGRSASPSYRNVSTTGQPSSSGPPMTSPSYRLEGGLVGAMGN